MELSLLFPTPVLTERNFLSEDSVNSIIELSEKQIFNSNSQCNTASHTSEFDLFNVVEGAELAKSLTKLGKLLFSEELEWKISSAWINKLDKGGFQKLHNHANSIISGIIYLTDIPESTATKFWRVPDGSNFNFRNEHSGSKSNMVSSDFWSQDNLKAGDMIIFPSYVYHEVPENMNEARYSIAFNAIPNKLKFQSYEINFS